MNTENPTRDFLERYLKLTHCDLFFADAAVLVEGNVERLLLPQMVEKVAPRLKSTYLSILEIGGAFGHRFRSLIEFLGITTLIVTDIDSVIGTPAVEEGEEERADDVGAEAAGARPGSACMVDVADAVTSNQTLIQWLPARRTIADLLAATPADRTQLSHDRARALIRVTYQTSINVTWRGTTTALTGRTLEEAFALQNLAWCQDDQRADLKLRIHRSESLTLEQLTKRLHDRVKGTSFNKTDFALALLAQEPEPWAVPAYIAQGLQWLQDEVTSIPPPHVPPVHDAERAPK
jgi:predicted ATP-dependent endonuclease of OLD family